MIVTSSPLRCSFFGGGSDIPQFYENNEGMVLSTTIDSKIYMAVNRCVAPHLKVIYSELELETNIENIKHNLVRECLKYFDLTSNMEICSFSDIPTKGTGLGSSSSYIVALLNAIHNIKYNTSMSPYALAELACHIEIDKCKQPIGKQDQYAAAFGGLNILYFENNDVFVEHLYLSDKIYYGLQENLFCFHTGINGEASNVLQNQVDNLKNNINIDATKQLVEMTKQSINLLKNDKIDDFGSLLHESWLIKKSLAKDISNSNIDLMYKIARDGGALGGKILGAGGRGYALFYVQSSNKFKFLEAMKNYQQLHFKFINVGSKVEMKT